MNRYRLLFSIILLLYFSPCLRAGEWQWSVTLDGFVSNETNRNPTAFLWIPADCMQVKAILVGQHNMSEETLFDNPLFPREDAEAGNRLCMDNTRHRPAMGCIERHTTDIRENDGRLGRRQRI